MLPYLDFPTIGPITSFGILVMIGVFVGVAAGSRHAERLGLDPKRTARMAMYCGIGGVLGAHYVDLFFYQPGWASRPGAIWTFLNPFAGISSYGGLIGGTLGFLVFSRKVSGKRLRFADAAAIGVVTLLVFGRGGCASVHDHVGVATDFALAVDFPAGNPAGVVGSHHDLGLYEMVLWAVLLAGSAILLHRPRRPGLYVGLLAIAYAVPRFFLDFLRREISDPRYQGLTVAQWSCIATLLAGIALLVWIAKHREAPPDRYLPPTPWREYIRDWFRLRPRGAA